MVRFRRKLGAGTVWKGNKGDHAALAGAGTARRHLREAAKQALQFSPVKLTGQQAFEVAKGFIRAIQDADYSVHACAILPEHVHLVLGRHARKPRRVVGHLKARATRQLRESGLWPDDEQPVWGLRAWVVYLDSLADVQRAIRYVERNPIKERKPLQVWSFVRPFVVAGCVGG